MTDGLPGSLLAGSSWRVVLEDDFEVVEGDDCPLEAHVHRGTRASGGETFALTVTNLSEKALRVRELVPYEVVLDLGRWSDGWILRHGCRSPGDPVAWVDLETCAALHPERDHFVISLAGGETVLAESLAALALPDGRGALLAFTTVADHATRVSFEVDRLLGVLRVRARSILGDVELAPGGAVTSETFLVEPTEDLWRAQAAWAGELGLRYGALTLPGERTGWSDWQYYRREVTQADAEENLAALTGRDWGIKYVLIDDGYQARMSEWLEPNDRWPDGARSVCAKIREKGLSPGLWIAPLTASSEGALPGEHPDWLVRGADGAPLGRSSHMGTVYAIDYSMDEPLRWLRGLVQTLVRDWGVEWIKLDGPILRYYDGARFANPRMTAVQVIRRALGAVRDSAGGAVIEGEGYYGPSIGMVHTQRVTQDIQTDWPRLRHTAYTNLMSNFMHGRLWTNNPDAFILRDTPSPHCHWGREEPVLSGDELEMEITALALTGGVVMLTDRMATLAPERAALIRSFIPPYDGAAEPVRFTPSAMGPELWRLRVARDFESWWVLARFNWTDEPVPLDVELAQATGEAGPWLVFDYWQRRFLGKTERVSDGFVRPHGVRLLAAKRDAGRPQLVGTDIHVTQGGVELESVEWDDRRNALRVVERSPVREFARLFLRVSGGFRLTGGRGPEGMVIDPPGPDGIMTVSYRARGAAETVIEFGRG